MERHSDFQKGNMRYRLGVDGRSMEGSVAGIGRYVYEICLVLERELPDFDLFIYSRGSITNCDLSARWIRRTDDTAFARWLKSVLWFKLRLPALARRDRLDVFWGGATFLPNLARRVQTVSTVHDINHLLVPWTMPRATFWAYRLFFASDVRRAGRIASNSLGTARRLQESLGRGSDIVAPPGVGPKFYMPGEEEVAAMLAQVGLRRPFILALATLEPRKNLGLLIDTYVALRMAGHLDGYELVIAGAKGWGKPVLPPGEPNWLACEIRCIGFVPNEVLPSLFRAAELFVFPSVYEGYGMPVAEAVACGARVLATDIPELREAGGNAVHYVPADAGALQKGILAALSQPRPALADVLPARVSWDETGVRYAELIRRAASDAAAHA
jgi:glycosyltransferase involved in cell wall biosynthesis